MQGRFLSVMPPAVALMCFGLALSGFGSHDIHAAAERPLDTESGMVIDENWELVKAHCTVCHSARQITQQRGSRETWTQLIRWMQDNQGLWQFDPATENNILDYLEKNYAPAPSYRRAPLKPELLPATATESSLKQIG